MQGLLNTLAEAVPLLRNLMVKELEDQGAESLPAFISEQALMAYEAKEATMDSAIMRQLERQVLLRIIDQKWIAHLHDIDALRESIGLRAYGQKDPLLEYKREAYETFQALMRAIQADFIHQVFHMQVVYEAPPSPFQMIMPEFFQGAEEGDIATIEDMQQLQAEMERLGLPMPPLPSDGLAPSADEEPLTTAFGRKLLQVERPMPPQVEANDLRSQWLRRLDLPREADDRALKAAIASQMDVWRQRAGQDGEPDARERALRIVAELVEAEQQLFADNVHADGPVPMAGDPDLMRGDGSNPEEQA